MSLPQQMQAAVLVAPRRFEIHKIPVPHPAEDEVLVRLEGCGLCGSNLPPFEGRPWFDYPRPAGDPGHEGWGEIAAIGPRVQGLQPGERVALLSYRAFAEYDVAPQSAVFKLPPQLEKKPAPGEALGCAFNVFRRAGIEAGHTVVVVGIGFLGALLTGLTAHAGARVVAVSRRPFALEIARRMGAAHGIEMDDHSRIISEVMNLTDGQGADRVIEAVGAQCPLDLAGELTRERGRLVIAGFHQDGPRQVNMQLWNWRGLDVINAHERDPKVYIQGMHEAVTAIAAGRLDPSPLYTHSFRLDEINQAFETVASRPEGFLKALVTP